MNNIENKNADTSIICVFDVDGTLTEPRKKVSQKMVEFLKQLKQKVAVALVGGSDLCKIEEQMGELKHFNYVFAENGLVAFKEGVKIGHENILTFVGEEILQKVINFSLGYMSQLTLPAKRGTFVEFRSSMINICPVGRSCSQEERLQFAAYDQEHGVRTKFAEVLREKFPDSGLDFAIGGQISIDVYPTGWDKTFCLKFIEKNYQTIHFFGDKTEKGGNDHEIYEDHRTIGHSVKSPEDTINQINELILSPCV